MAIQAAASVEANTVTPPTHLAGDTLVAIVARHGNHVAPTVPAGWLVLQYRPVTTGTVTRCLIVAVKIAATNTETFGTWTNATHVMCAVYRATNILVGGGSTCTGQNATTSVQYVALLSHTAVSTQTNRFMTASSLMIAAAYVTENTSAIATPPAGTTHRATLTGVTNGRLVLFDTNGGVASWPLTSVTVTSTDAVSAVAELADSGLAKSGSTLIVIED